MCQPLRIQPEAYQLHPCLHSHSHPPLGHRVNRRAVSMHVLWWAKCRSPWNLGRAPNPDLEEMGRKCFLEEETTIMTWKANRSVTEAVQKEGWTLQRIHYYLVISYVCILNKNKKLSKYLTNNSGHRSFKGKVSLTFSRKRPSWVKWPGLTLYSFAPAHTAKQRNPSLYPLTMQIPGPEPFKLLESQFLTVQKKVRMDPQDFSLCWTKGSHPLKFSLCLRPLHSIFIPI